MLTVVCYCLAIFLYLFLTEDIVTETVILLIPAKIKFPLYTLVEYSFFAVLIYQQLKLRSLKAIIIGLIIFIFSRLFIISWTIKSKNRFIPIGFETILIFIFIFFFLYEEFKDVKDCLSMKIIFDIDWVVHLSGRIVFIYLYANTLEDPKLVKYWFTYIVEIIKNILFISPFCVFEELKTNQTQIRPAQSGLHAIKHHTNPCSCCKPIQFMVSFCAVYRYD
jgi:hypothetical protein